MAGGIRDINSNALETTNIDLHGRGTCRTAPQQCAINSATADSRCAVPSLRGKLLRVGQFVLVGRNHQGRVEVGSIFAACTNSDFGSGRTMGRRPTASPLMAINSRRRRGGTAGYIRPSGSSRARRCSTAWAKSWT